MPLSAIDGKVLSLNMDWTRRSPDDPTMLGDVSLTLKFSAVGKLLSNDCPIVNASASLGGVVLRPSGIGGTLRCSHNDDLGCDKACLWASWDGDVTSLLLSSPDTMDLVLKDSGGEAVITIRNPVSMVQTTVLDLTEGQVVRYGDSFHVRVSAEPPVSNQDIDFDMFVRWYQAGQSQSLGLPKVSDVERGPNVWRVDIVPAGVGGGSAAVAFRFRSTKMRFDACPSDYVCSGFSATERGWLSVEYSP